MASLSLAAVTFSQALSTNIFVSSLDPLMSVLSAMNIQLPSSWNRQCLPQWHTWQMVLSFKGLWDFKTKKMQHAERDSMRERWQARWACLTCSLPWISRGWISLSQPDTGADCPTDRRPRTAATTKVNFIMARHFYSHKSPSSVCPWAWSWSCLLRAKTGARQFRRSSHEQSWVVYTCVAIGRNVNNVQGLLFFIQTAKLGASKMRKVLMSDALCLLITKTIDNYWGIRAIKQKI